MLDPRIRLRHLRCFLETARLGSLSAAADVLNVSQPAVSKTIRELEEVLGKPLFDRSHRRLTMTAVGRVFQQHAGAASEQGLGGGVGRGCANGGSLIWLPQSASFPRLVSLVGAGEPE